MKVAYLSDIHLDFWVQERDPQKDKFTRQLSEFISMIDPQEADVMIIAGDLGHHYAQDCAFLKAMRQIYKHVILVAGNHDFYLVSRNIQEKYKFNSLNRIKEMKEFCSSNPGIHYLDGTSVEINGVTFAGACAGWDDSYFQKINKYKPTKDEIVNLFRRTMNDARLIFTDGASNTKIDHFDFYPATNFTTFDPVKHFASEMVKLNGIASVDVMITHYGPAVPPDMQPAYATSSSTTFYYFNGDEIIDRLGPKFWVYGHTHDFHEFTHRGTQILCNPLGYPGEQGFARIKYFDV